MIISTHTNKPKNENQRNKANTLYTRDSNQGTYLKHPHVKEIREFPVSRSRYLTALVAYVSSQGVGPERAGDPHVGKGKQAIPG